MGDYSVKKAAKTSAIWGGITGIFMGFGLWIAPLLVRFVEDISAQLQLAPPPGLTVNSAGVAIGAALGVAYDAMRYRGWIPWSK